MLRILCSLFVLMLATSTWASPLSPAARISLITCSSGEELYSAFGHTAIRVRDPELGIDSVFNYGTFDYGEGFYTKFARGKLDYYLNAYLYKDDPQRRGYGFFEEYRFYKRSFYEQVLDLSPRQTQEVYDFLIHNLKPGNQYYRYDFFFDNCATRPRDVFFEVLSESLLLPDLHTPGELSFRELIDQYLGDRPWADFGIDLALGAVIDEGASPWQQMFLPDYLAKHLARTQNAQEKGTVPLVSHQQSLFEIEHPLEAPAWYMAPIYPLSILFLLVAGFTWIGRRRTHTRYVSDGVLFILLGQGGLLLAFLWFGTDHRATAQNWNLLWLLPTHLLAGIMLLLARRPAWLKYYFLGTAAISLLLLIGWGLIPQQFHIAIVPLLLISLIRSGRIYYEENGFRWR